MNKRINPIDYDRTSDSNVVFVTFFFYRGYGLPIHLTTALNIKWIASQTAVTICPPSASHPFKVMWIMSALLNFPRFP